MYRKIAFLIIISIALIYSALSFAGMIVFDPSNFAKNSITAAQTIQTAENTLNTYRETVQAYQQLVAQYQLTVTDLEELANINQLIQQFSNTVNNYYGTTPMSQLATLNPNSANYAEQRDTILAQYFQKPTDPSLIQAEFQGALTQDQIDAMKAEAQLQNLNYQTLKDAIDESTHEQDKAAHREQYIQNYGQTIQGLGANSELKTQQTTAAEINLQLEQNEQLIQQGNEALKYARMQKADADSEKAKESQAEQTSLQKAINQGTSGLGRNSWGDF